MTVADIMPVFSVVIPCYNRASSILATLHSVQAQAFGDYECIIVDDGSEDGDILAEVVTGLRDNRFRIIRQENAGGGAARNTGIFHARGEYIAFLDSDDLFLPEKLERFAEVIEPDEARAWYAPTFVERGVKQRWVRPDCAIGPDEDMGEYLFVKNQFIQTSTIVIPTVAARKTPFDPTLRKGQDLDFCLRLYAAGVRFTMLPECLTVWVDVSETGRTSRKTGYQSMIAWLERARTMMTPAAVRGYRATVLAYYLSGAKPFTALRYILSGWLLAGVPASVAARQLLRGFVPRGLYRRMVNTYVALCGKS